MLACFTEQLNYLPIYCLQATELESWLSQQPKPLQQWVQSNRFSANSDQVLLYPNAQGVLEGVLYGIKNKHQLWEYADLYRQLPPGHYKLQGEVDNAWSILAWGLAAYDYKKKVEQGPCLYINKVKYRELLIIIEAIYWIRDLINTPANEMGPKQLQTAAFTLKRYQALVTMTSGELLQKNYPAIYSVGQASANSARLIDLHWGDKHDPLVVLIGKGVCFDTGGLNLKPMQAMRWMKKDMGGAAHVLALARCIMELELPICLRVLIPAVENSVSGHAYRPGDVISSRSGQSIEISHTDAEGRVCLADALTAAGESNPDLIIDIATLTGAARVALGPEIAAFFTPDDQLATDLMTSGHQVQDPLWRLPLYQEYRSLNSSQVADIKNSAEIPYGGAITAALFLQSFVTTTAWIHLDVMAWNLKSKPGRPEGGEAMGLRALLHFLQKRYPG